MGEVGRGVGVRYGTKHDIRYIRPILTINDAECKEPPKNG